MADRATAALTMEAELARALALLSTGIYALTVSDGERRHGMSASWVTQVSGDPPQLMAAVDRRHQTHEILTRAGRFGLNVIGMGSRHLEDYFYSGAEQRADNLVSLAWEDSPSGVPYLRDAMASLECRIGAQHTAGDHTLFVAAVTHWILRTADRPLTSLDLEYVYVGDVIRRPR
jgi:flavin reductase (DIM6/NTAB) family NADH-FMN oxidoreductase RutF